MKANFGHHCPVICDLAWIGEDSAQHPRPCCRAPCIVYSLPCGFFL
jgi:hypothetical protein